MFKSLVVGKCVVLGVVLTACAPPGQGALGYRDIDWPRADHTMTFSENREIEVLLNRLGYMKGGVDGQITRQTRGAIRVYQRDIGAPITGYVSTPLLNSLRVNAPAEARPAQARPQPVAQTTPRRRTPVRRPAATPQPASGGGGGSGGAGGAGGSGGGAWN